MKHNFCGRRAALEGEVQAPVREERDSEVLKSPFLVVHIIHFSKLVLTRW